MFQKKKKNPLKLTKWPQPKQTQLVGHIWLLATNWEPMLHIMPTFGIDKLHNFSGAYINYTYKHMLIFTVTFTRPYCTLEGSWGGYILSQIKNSRESINLLVCIGWTVYKMIRSILSKKPETTFSPRCFLPSQWGFFNKIHLVQETWTAISPLCLLFRHSEVFWIDSSWPRNLRPLFHHCALFRHSKVSWLRSILSKKPETAILPLCLLFRHSEVFWIDSSCPRNLRWLFCHCALFRQGEVSWSILTKKPETAILALCFIPSRWSFLIHLDQETWDGYFGTVLYSVTVKFLDPSWPRNPRRLFWHCALFRHGEVSRSMLTKKPETAILALCFIPSRWSFLIHLDQETWDGYFGTVLYSVTVKFLDPSWPRNPRRLFWHCALFRHGEVSWSILTKKPEMAILALCFIPSRWSFLIHLDQETWDGYFGTVLYSVTVKFFG